MEYGISDSSGTDDDLPPSHQTRIPRVGRAAGNGRSAVMGSLPYARLHNDMETQIRYLEQEAYGSVLRAFKAQSDAITWEKEGVMTELRKELRVSDEEHRELLNRVNADDIIRRIRSDSFIKQNIGDFLRSFIRIAPVLAYSTREWRQAGGLVHGNFLSNAQPMHEPLPSPTVSASRKKQRTSASMSLNAPSSALHPQSLAASVHPSSSTAKRGAASGSKGKKSKSGQVLPGVSPVKAMPHPSSGPAARGHAANSGEPTTYDRLIGRKVRTRWPDDDNFYEAVVTDYNPAKDLHALVYDMHTNNETWEWVNLKEIPPEDIRWEGEDPGISSHWNRIAQGRGSKKSGARATAVPGGGRGRGGIKSQVKKDLPPSQNGIGKKVPDDIELLQTDTLIKEVERVFSASHPDPLEMDKAKKMLKEHEQALVDAIARLGDASDGESDDGERPFLHGQSTDQERGWRNQPYGGNQAGIGKDPDGGRGGEGSEGDHMAVDGRAASDDQQDGDDI
ncbi:hypothetical protein Sjap_012678 [Stephania japonica]|uniref:ENT domain-containing protein n=1 Tax=Stephania japonica TaxID=461633 RepID=A0AAP0IYY3_9MAGN